MSIHDFSTNKKNSMKHILFVYMLALALIISFASFALFYISGQSSYTIKIILLILYIIFVILCCGYLSKLYTAPILKILEKIKHPEYNTENNYEKSYSEVNSLLELIGEKEKRISDAYLELDRISCSTRSQIDPDDYEYFKSGLKTLTGTEKRIFNLYLAGKSSHEILEINGIKERTLKFHNSNIYSKLGVQSRKELLRYATIYEKEKTINQGVIS